MTWFTATSVTVNNGQTVVSVNAGDDIQLAQESGGLIIGNNPPVEIKRSYLDGSNNKKIELRSAWPYANQAAQPAVAFPTDGDLAAATAVLKQLIDGFALATQAQAEQGTNNTAAMTALRVKQAIDFFRPLTTSANDTTAGRVWRTNDLVKTNSATDNTAGRMIKTGDFGLSNPINLDAAPYNGNANALTATNGLFRVGAAWTGSPYSGTNGNNQGLLKVSVWAGGLYAVQEFFNINSVWAKQTRRFNNGVWEEWVIDYAGKNILGTVSQSVGVPTGAIIQRGSNANGEFVRFADGTQICLINRGVVNLTANVDEVYTWTFPISFINDSRLVIPTLGGASSTNDFNILKMADGTASITSASVRVKVSVTQTHVIRLMAIGRWI